MWYGIRLNDPRAVDIVASIFRNGTTFHEAFLGKFVGDLKVWGGFGAARHPAWSWTRKETAYCEHCL